MKQLPISVIINTKNSHKYLERCLKSAAFSDDIVVVDMNSQDDTIEIAKKFTNRIFSFDDVGYVEPARNFAIAKAKHDWIFVLDADEEISTELKNQLEDLISSKVEVYDVPRKNIVFDKWLQHAGWWPDYQRRFFKKGHVVWQDKIHSIPTVTGQIKKLPPLAKNAIIHHNYQTIEQYIDRLNKYTSIESLQNKLESTDQAKIIREAFAELFRRYFKEEGFKDNVHGLSVSMLQVFYQVVKQLKIWQSQGFQDMSDSVSDQLSMIIKEFKYWYAYYRQKSTKNPFAKLYWKFRMHFKI